MTELPNLRELLAEAADHAAAWRVDDALAAYETALDAANERAVALRAG
jgi:hypothetical protein